MSSLQELMFDLQESVYSILHNEGVRTEQEFNDKIYNVVIGECLEVVYRNKPDVRSILMEYGLMKAIIQWDKNNDQPLDREADQEYFGSQLLMDVLRQETEFCFCDYEQRYEIDATTEIFEMTE